MHRSMALGLLLAFLPVGASTVKATTMVELPLDRMIEEAESVFVGKVESTGTRMAVLEGRATPMTITRFRVTRWLKGGDGEVVSIREPGGVWARGSYRVEGTPRYAVGEEVVVFLERDPEGHLRTYGRVQGKFVVKPANEIAPKTVVRDFAGVGLVRWKDDRMLLEHGGVEPAATLEELVRYIEARRSGAAR